MIVGGVDDTWSADLVDMQSFSKHNDGVKYLLNVIDVFSKYAWSVPLIDKTGKNVIRAFDTIVGKRKPSKMWVDRGGEFYNRAMDRWLEENGIELGVKTPLPIHEGASQDEVLIHDIAKCCKKPSAP